MDAVDEEALAKLRKLVKDVDPEQAPSRKELLEMVETLELTEEAKENLKAMLTGDVPKVFGTQGGGLLAVVFILVVFAIIFFFGYKLYKSIKDKEKKKEEKKKAKQSKKKK